MQHRGILAIWFRSTEIPQVRLQARNDTFSGPIYTAWQILGVDALDEIPSAAILTFSLHADNVQSALGSLSPGVAP